MTDTKALKARMDAARTFPVNTRPAIRHAQCAAQDRMARLERPARD